MEKPKKVLCKRSLIIGDPFYYDHNDNKIERDNRMLVKGDWYDVVYNEHDNENTFTIIDNQGTPHLHWMYNEGDKNNWPSFCKDYGPRDYAKWFYTPEELELKHKRQKTHMIDYKTIPPEVLKQAEQAAINWHYPDSIAKGIKDKNGNYIDEA